MQELLYIVIFFTFLLSLISGFYLGTKWQEKIDTLKMLQFPNVDNLPREVNPFLEAIKKNQPAQQIKADVSQSKVMKNPSPQEIRKRREQEIMKQFEQDTTPREHGSYVI